MNASEHFLQQEQYLKAWLWATPNSNRISILFEELGLDYTVVPINIRRGEQNSPDVKSRNPYGKVPVVSWNDASGERVLFESGAILLDFAQRHARLIPEAGQPLSDTLAWLMVALTGLGPAMGQAHHWTDLAPSKPEEARAHSVGLVRRAYSVLDERLSNVQYLGGAYSIADIAAFPWISRSNWATLSLQDYPHLANWHDRVASRPAVAIGMSKPEGAVLQD
jgi:GST-like protein